MDTPDNDASLVDACATAIKDAFADYDARFDAITRNARGHFERRDWAGARRDAGARNELSDTCVA
jgi:isocitrate dehydrogenase kinase/phosphatase